MLHPIDPQTTDLLARVVRTAAAQEVDVLLVGAFARDVLFCHMHGIESGRLTQDVDLSVQVRSWAAFTALQQALCANGFEVVEPEHPEKIRDMHTRREVDLVPFGPIAGPQQSLQWPGDGPVWSLVGLDDAFAHALRLPLPHEEGLGQTARIISLPSLAMLKIVALHDRPETRRKKDATDIGFTVQHYLDAGNGERLIQEHGDLLRTAAKDRALAGAAMLGRDMRKVASVATREYLVPRLRHEATSSSNCPLARSLAQTTCNGQFQRARQLLTALLEGLERCHS